MLALSTVVKHSPSFLLLNIFSVSTNINEIVLLVFIVTTCLYLQFKESNRGFRKLILFDFFFNFFLLFGFFLRNKYFFLFTIRVTCLYSLLLVNFSFIVFFISFYYNFKKFLLNTVFYTTFTVIGFDCIKTIFLFIS